jgi:hypothetical protein
MFLPVRSARPVLLAPWRPLDPQALLALLARWHQVHRWVLLVRLRP